MDLMTKQGSYVERRQLFKDIWDTAMHIDEKDADILNKPRIIKTLRLGEVDKCVVGKKKKQRIRNLRTVCKKILDFCDRQDADDIFYAQIVADGKESREESVQILPKIVKVNKSVKKKQVKKTKSLFSPPNEFAQAKTRTSELKEDFMRNAGNKTSRTTSTFKINRTTTSRTSEMTYKSLKSKKSSQIIGTTGVNVLGDARAAATQQKDVKKKLIKKKRPPDSHASPGTPRDIFNRSLGIPAPTARAVRQPLQICKLLI